MDTPSVCILFSFQVMKLALGLGGCHGDPSQLPTPHRPSSSSRQPFWARKERSGIPLLFLLLCREEIQLRVLWCYLIWLSPPGSGQWLATNPGGFLFALLYQLIIPRGDQRKEEKKWNQGNVHVIYILSSLARSAEGCSFLSFSDPSFNVIFLLLSRSYCLLISPSKIPTFSFKALSRQLINNIYLHLCKGTSSRSSDWSRFLVKYVCV